MIVTLLIFIIIPSSPTLATKDKINRYISYCTKYDGICLKYQFLEFRYIRNYNLHMSENTVTFFF